MKFSPYIRIVEDVVVVAGTAIGTWQSTRDAQATVEAVSVAPVVRSFLAATLSGGRSSGLVEALKLVRAALAVQAELTKAQAAPATAPVAAPADTSDLKAAA